MGACKATLQGAQTSGLALLLITISTLVLQPRSGWPLATPKPCHKLGDLSWPHTSPGEQDRCCYCSHSADGEALLEQSGEAPWLAHGHPVSTPRAAQAGKWQLHTLWAACEHWRSLQRWRQVSGLSLPSGPQGFLSGLWGDFPPLPSLEAEGMATGLTPRLGLPESSQACLLGSGRSCLSCPSPGMRKKGGRSGELPAHLE